MKDLRTMVKILLKSFRRLRQRQYWKDRVSGGAFVIEITGRPNNWHAHIHALVHAKYLDFNKLIPMWNLCTTFPSGGYITRLPPSVKGAYLCKYVTKPTGIDQVDTGYNEALKGSRLFASFGAWYAINLTYTKPLYECKGCKTPAFLWFVKQDYLEIDNKGSPIDCQDRETLDDFRMMHPEDFQRFIVEKDVDYS